MPDHSQFNSDRTHPGRWTITFDNPPINMFVPTTIVELGALMTDLEADPSVKVVVFQSANPDFFIARFGVRRPPTASTRSASGSATRTGQTGMPLTWWRSSQAKSCRNERLRGERHRSPRDVEALDRGFLEES